jgi:beta-glucanase (GH16 family)
VKRPLLASVGIAVCASVALSVGPTALAASPGASTPAGSAMTPGATRQVTQRATLRLSPGIAQNGRTPASPDAASLLGSVSFSPARRGRTVIVQRRAPGQGWHSLIRTRQDTHGQVSFVADDKLGARPYTYRAIAAPRTGLPAVVSNTESSAVWRLAFEDRFGGTSLDPAKWDYRHLGLLQGSRLHAQSDRSAVQVGGGALTLQVRRNPHRRAGYYYNGHISTDGKFAFRYGYAAARVKFQRGQGQHGGFWLQPQSALAPYGSPARTGAEIDVAEFFGAGYPRGGMASYVYTYPSRTRTVKSGDVLPSASRALRGRSDSWWSRYHVFSVRWTPSGYIFRIDGVDTWRHFAHASQRPQFLILSLLSSDWELPQLDRSTLPVSMKVDWVRAWQR